jgi:hypothetical protein
MMELKTNSKGSWRSTSWRAEPKIQCSVPDSVNSYLYSFLLSSYAGTKSRAQRVNALRDRADELAKALK